ncbi:hypothetical protein CAPTEDRAFT_172869 [Capitella teleta]|uniref:C2H2-type domain-containing protein n=1 Tax=Capitella teleta TaxID=283909 RepID=R7UX80_CAPTE|nr:hypothetical protein CAPTEDRAFT_172869 [Capitella teleta]|eukprot:ELU10954.1 hypothetical protein CAPTEDRAFT_172869 [Capitella teleta]
MRETDIYREMLPKKRKLNASDLDHSLNDEPASIPSPEQVSCNNTEKSDVGCWPELPDQSAVCHAEDLSIPPCIIHIAPIDDSNGQTNRVEQATKQFPNISKVKGSHHKCEDCPETFANHASLKIHSLRCHNKGSLFTCTDCDFKSPRKKDVQAHLLAKHKKAPPGVRIFKCKQCEYMCMDKNRFNEHMNCHSKDNRHKCSKCDKAYSTRRGLQTHLQYHSQERPHKCTDCDASFKVRDKLRDHIRLMHTHKGQKPFKCSYCNHASALRGNCNQHIRKTHPGMPISVTDTRVKDKSKSENAYSSLLTLPLAQESASSDSAA